MTPYPTKTLWRLPLSRVREALSAERLHRRRVRLLTIALEALDNIDAEHDRALRDGRTR